MTRRPDPTWVYHFTRVEHLSSLITHGLVSDTRAHRENLLEFEVGNLEIKSRRSNRVVPIHPGGVVADYVPFYFAPRSPMMYAIHRGGVPSYQDGCERLIYLATSLQLLQRHNRRWVVTDRNAALEFARFTADDGEVTHLVDWPLMTETYWNNTEADPDRRERRQAECLVHEHVPWLDIRGVAAKTQAVADEVNDVLARHGHDQTRCKVRPDLYF